MKKILYVALVVAFVMTACGRKEASKEIDKTAETTVGYEAIGDSTKLALACEGCTDSVLVLLFDDCSDPVFYDIIEARKQHRIHGNPSVGDRMAVLINPDNENEILFAVNLSQLRGSWVYEVMPTLREKSAINDEDRVKTSAEKAETDSLIRSLMKPRECGFTLKQDYVVTSIGRQWQRNTLDEESPVVFPPVKFYTEWHIFNGKIILTETTFAKPDDKQQQKNRIANDTADIVLLSRDSLVLKFKDAVQGYNRKAETE